MVAEWRCHFFIVIEEIGLIKILKLAATKWLEFSKQFNSIIMRKQKGINSINIQITEVGYELESQ